MKAYCSVCGEWKTIKPFTGVSVCYLCWPSWDHQRRARREALENARHLAERSGHPSKGGDRKPLRSVSTGKAAGAQESVTEAGAEGMRAASTTATASAADRFWSEDEFEDDRRGLLAKLLGPELASRHGLTPKYEEEL